MLDRETFETTKGWSLIFNTFDLVLPADVDVQFDESKKGDQNTTVRSWHVYVSM